MSTTSPRIALLIDSDNVSAHHISAILVELTKHGTTAVRRMYGDWTTDQLRGWKNAANEHSIQPIQQFAYTSGKNSTDSALIIDAMDLLHQNHLDAFAIVSSDSDFTRLAARLRESGAKVFGFGARKTPTPFVNACDTFIYFDVLDFDAEEAPELPVDRPSKEASVPRAAATRAASRQVSTRDLRMDSRLMNLLRAGITAGADDDGWANLGGVGSNVQKQSPDFDSRNWGYAKLGDLIDAVGLFEIKRAAGRNGGTNVEVRLPTNK